MTATLADVAAWHRAEADGYRRRAETARAYADSYAAQAPTAPAVGRHRRMADAGDILARYHDELAAAAETRAQRQATVASWCAAAFGAEHATSLPQRGLRLLEEAAEAYQAAGGDLDMARRCLEVVFSRPSGELGQELGGVEVTVLALAAAARLDADECGQAEVRRVLSKPIAHFHARNAEKNRLGLDHAAYPSAPTTDRP